MKAQEKIAFIEEYELSAELGLGAAAYGSQLKVNHTWFNKNRLQFLSGMGISTYWDRVYTYTQFNPDLAALSDISGFRNDNHLRIYTGLRYSLFRNRSITLSAEAYTGGYNILHRGNYQHERTGINRNYTAHQFFFDYGMHLGLIVKLNQRLSMKGTITNTFRRLNYGFKYSTTVFQYAPDNKNSLGIGVIYSLR